MVFEIFSKKRKLTRSLVIYDIVTFVIFFISVFLVFEFMIKDILYNSKIEKLFDLVYSTEYDFSTAVKSLEEKKVLPYKDNFDFICKYFRKNILDKMAFDDSFFGIFLENNYKIEGKKSDRGYSTELDYHILQSYIDKRILFLSQETYNKIINKIKNSSFGKEEKDSTIDFFSKNYSFDKKTGKYLFINEFNDEKRDLIMGILVNSLEMKEFNEIVEYIKINKKNYIGIIKYSDVRVKENFDRNSKKYIKPIILLADKSSDFFYIINQTRNIFIGWLILIVGLLAFLKFRATKRATKEIEIISDMLNKESVNIKTKGLIGEALSPIDTKFVEIEKLNNASQELNSALNDLKEVVLGVTNEEFFIGTITKNRAVIDQHDVFMSVMFLDIKGFTSITEKHKNHAMKIGITIWTEVGKIIRKYNGEIRKLLGDAVLITFKDKDIEYSSTINSLKAGIEILKDVERINKLLNKEFNPNNDSKLKIDFNFRIGIECGVVSEGLYGSKDNFEYGIIGDAVNTASRFEALNKQYNTNLLFTDNLTKMIGDFLKKNNSGLDLSDYLKKEFSVELFNIDRARPKGKVTPNIIYTLFFINNNKYYIIGNFKKDYSLDIIKEFLSTLEKFHKSIVLWKEYNNSNDEEKLKNANKLWKNIVKDFAELYYEKDFVIANQFIKLMLSVEEYEKICKDYSKWKNKTNITLNPPSLDWLENEFLARELEK